MCVTIFSFDVFLYTIHRFLYFNCYTSGLRTLHDRLLPDDILITFDMEFFFTVVPILDIPIYLCGKDLAANIHGADRGSPLTPVIADTSVEHFEKETLNSKTAEGI